MAKAGTERLYAELQAGDGRTLRGAAIRYGETQTVHGRPTRFLAGAFGDVSAADLILNRQHERGQPLARTGGGGLTLTDTPEALEVLAELPDTQAARDAHTMVRTGVLRGLSIEFRALAEGFVNGVREIRRGVLEGVGVVDTPAFATATVEALAAPGERRKCLLLLH